MPIGRNSPAGWTCLVTGAGSGVGRALVHTLARTGATVWGCDVSPANLAATRAELAERPYRDAVVLHQTDVTDRADLEEWIRTAHTATGRIDVLVNNAAFIRWLDVAEMTVDDAKLTMQTAYDATVYGVKAVYPLMEAARRGHIITIGSSAGRIYVKGPSAAYAASKAALEAYMRVLQLELKGTPIRATLVRPGVIAGTQFFGEHVPSSRLPRFADFTPISSPQQIAAAIATSIVNPRDIIDIPRILPALYWAFAAMPRTMQYLVGLGGPARRDYGPSQESS
ncbi:SDR family NAD(P)-dependent oxidoreductase [Streptomyces sp. NPDC057011]|uniref:SDR family NAD(P)-dependent oxidoreductase n=1 Tax=unclassified Streptomyces TaxID=2593676 RepID=UPI00364520FC